MTPTRATEAATDFGQWHNHVSAGLGDFGRLAERPWSEIRLIELFPGCRLDSPTLVVPGEWLPAGATRRLSFRTVDPALAGVPADPVLAAKRDETVRRALLAVWLPKMTRTGVRQYKPGPWVVAANTVLRMAAWQYAERPTADGTIFAHLTFADLATGMLPTLGARPARAQSLLRCLIEAGQRGIIADWPEIYAEPAKPATALNTERSRKGRTAAVRGEPASKRNFQPFSDEFVTQLMTRTLWLHENLADPLLQCWKLMRKITTDLGMSTNHTKLSEARAEVLRSFVWRSPGGKVIDSLPFPTVIRAEAAGDKPVLSSEWPFLYPRDVNRFVNTLQALNMCVVNFCTGARSSELSAAEDQVLGKSNDRFHSLTFKLVDEATGQPRDWPLHPAAVRALVIQHKISSLVRAEGEKHLWVSPTKPNSEGGSVRFELTEAMVGAIEHLGLTDLAKPDRAHAHRWRHTVAKLVALSVIGAPQVLLDLFGHRDLDMTLKYMLSDPRLVEEAMKVAKETSFAMAEEAIVDVVGGETGGPAAAQLRQGLAMLGMQRGEQAFDTTTLRETAEILTFNGRYWSLVRAGVLCTKSMGEFGPCTRDRGAPDPGSCHTDCGHRLELGRAKQMCEGALRALLDERDRAAADGAEMLLANLDGQICAQLKRWDDVRDRIVAEHPVARKIWDGRQS